MLWSAVKMMTWITVTYVAAKEMEMKLSFKNIRRIVLKQWRTLHEIWGGDLLATYDYLLYLESLLNQTLYQN